jgi:acetyl esterase/lipase
MDPRPHGLAEESIDEYTRLMHSTVPQAFQKSFRDQGYFRDVADNSVMLAASMMVPYYKRFLSLGSSQRSFKYGDEADHYIHVIDLSTHHNHNHSKHNHNVEKKTKVVIFVHGGAWGSGKPWMYRLSAAGLAKCVDAPVVVLVQYRVFPNNHILSQRDEVIKAIEFVRGSDVWKPDFLRECGGDVELILSGHSSGANVGALAILKAVDDGYRLADSWIGLSGVYHIYKHYLWEKARGVHLISPMRGAAELSGGFDLCSPTTILQRRYHQQQASAAEAITTALSLFPTMLVLHGYDDRTVPVSSSLEFAQELVRFGVSSLTHRAFLPDMDHGGPIMDLLLDDCDERSATGRAVVAWQREVHASRSHPQARL